jgi:hypothetical protein
MNMGSIAMTICGPFLGLLSLAADSKLVVIVCAPAVDWPIEGDSDDDGIGRQCLCHGGGGSVEDGWVVRYSDGAPVRHRFSGGKLSEGGAHISDSRRRRLGQGRHLDHGQDQRGIPRGARP